MVTTIDELIEELCEISKAGFGYSRVTIGELINNVTTIVDDSPLQLISSGDGSLFYIVGTGI